MSRDRNIPPEAKLYARAFDAYLRTRREAPEEQQAAERMTATLNILAQARLSREPVRSHLPRVRQAA